MNKEIKSKIEEYVKDGFNSINQLNPTEDGYYSARGNIIKEISTLVDLLQKEDVNNSNSKFNDNKIINENTKIVKEYEFNQKKLESEVKENGKKLDLEKEKINKGYEIDSKKIQADLSRLDNDIIKINNEHDINNKKILCDIDKIKNEVTKINQDYEINITRNQIEKDRNKDNLHLENRKIDNEEIKNNSSNELKEKELKINEKYNIGISRDRIIKVVIDGVVILVPAIIYNVWMKRGFEFEETGTFTSNTFRNLWSKLKL